MGSDRYRVDYTTSLGSTLERNNGMWKERLAMCRSAPVAEKCMEQAMYPDMLPIDEKGITYTSEPLQEDTYVIGHPVMRSWVSLDREDADLFVILEEVHEAGFSQYVADGAFRLSHRTLNEAPFDALGVPWLGNYEADRKSATGEPVQLALDIKPIANVFDKGHRIRITIVGADRDAYPVEPSEPSPTLQVHYGGRFDSHVDLPLIPAL
jgi:putative CocE/NonD family hydrolase